MDCDGVCFKLSYTVVNSRRPITELYHSGLYFETYVSLSACVLYVTEFTYNGVEEEMETYMKINRAYVLGKIYCNGTGITCKTRWQCLICLPWYT